MPFEHRDHQADVMLVAWGATLIEAFESAAQGLLELMVDTSKVSPATSVAFSCEADEVSTLCVSFLNEVLFVRDQQEMFFCAVSVLEIAERDGVYTLCGVAWGEPVDFRKHRVRAEVKAATYGGLCYRTEMARIGWRVFSMSRVRAVSRQRLSPLTPCPSLRPKLL